MNIIIYITTAVIVMASQFNASHSIEAESIHKEHSMQNGASSKQVDKYQEILDFTIYPFTNMLIFEAKTGYIRQYAQVSKDFSRACSDGTFNQTQDRKYVGVFGGSVYGAAIKGKMLYDPNNIAKSDTFYFFDNETTTQCTVYSLYIKELIK